VESGAVDSITIRCVFACRHGWNNSAGYSKPEVFPSRTIVRGQQYLKDPRNYVFVGHQSATPCFKNNDGWERFVRVGWFCSRVEARTTPAKPIRTPEHYPG